MGDQEIDYLQKLHLSTVCDHHHHPATAARNSGKRPRSPVSKMATLYPPFSPSADQDFHGFNRIPLPENFTAASPPPLRRTLSEPIPVCNQQIVAAAATPPRPPRSRNPSRSPNCGESPSSKRLKKMKERLREMSHWWNQVASEDEEDEEKENLDSHHHDPKEESEEDVDNNPSQEAVFVEKNGECVVLHFQCPCGNGYQILLSGNSCYYKLTNYRSC